jgi:hypothetical protein
VLLLVTVGVPYLAVAASSPLLQLWFTHTDPGRSPYRLFALSNAGSLLGLVTYPFLLEPLLATGTQTRIWSVTFGLYVLLCGVCAARLFRFGSGAARPVIDRPATPVGTRDRILWLLLAACGSLMLLATTSQMTQDVAVVPLLWVLPLGLYLATFVICFDHARWYDRRVWVPLWCLVLGAVVYMLWSEDLTLVQQVGVYRLTVFTSCMVCHGELVRRRPAAVHLTSFYLTVAGGGALTYYGESSGVALAIALHPRRDVVSTNTGTGLRIGVAGLGTGTVAAHGRAGDTVRFYEINPEVERIANEYFYFLRDARSATEVVLGDGRISLERELRQQGAQQFDVLVLDAFSGDAIPTHLLTREATQLYWQHLREDGVLVVHVSNKYLNLRPVVRGAAEALDKRFLLFSSDPPGEEHSGSTWVVVTSNGVAIERLRPHATYWPREVPQSLVWTDNYSSLLSVLD